MKRLIMIILMFQVALLQSTPEKGFQLPEKQLQLLEQTETHLLLRWEAGNYSLEQTQREGEVEDILRIEGLTNEAAPGEPALPSVNQLIALPPQGKVVVRVTPLEEKRFTNRWIPPAQMDYENGDQTGYIKSERIYNQDEDFPASYLGEVKPVIFRDLRVLPLHFYPARFNPVKKELTLCTRAEIEIEILPEKGINEKEIQDNSVSEAFIPLYESLITGAEQYLRDMTVVRGGYLIIAGDGYINSLQSFVEWKRELGYPVTLVPKSQAGNTNTAIRNYVQNFYQTADLRPDFFLIVGDVDGTNQVPTFFYNGDASDLDYVLIEGNDYFPEMLYGRISVDSPLEVQVIVNKIIGYEKTPYVQNTNWFRRGLNVCSYYHAHSILWLMRWVRNLVLSSGYTQVDTIYYPAQSSANSLPVYVNQGVNFVNYRGWAGSSGWYEPDYHVEDIDPDLNNGWKLPIVTSVVCGTANYASYTDPCFAEEWMRVGTPTTPKGAVAYFGCSEFNQNVRFANIIDAGLYWGIFQEGIRTMGAATLRGKMEAYRGFPNYQSPGGTLEFYFHIYQLMGDPGMKIWVGPPLQMQVSHPAEINVNSSYVIVDAYSTGGMPLRNAYVALYQENTLQVGGYVNSAGRIALPLSGLNPGNLTVTVSYENYQPYQGNISVVGGDFINVENVTFIDTTAGDNNNNQLDAGETADMVVSLHNFGNSPVMNLVAHLLSSDPRLTVVEDSSSMAEIGGNQVDTLDFPFVLQASAQIPGGTEIPLLLELTSGDTIDYEVPVIITVGGYNAELEEVTIDDEGGDGNIGPGESGNLIPVLRNIGTLGLGNGMTLILSCETEGVVILDDNLIIPPIAPGTAVALDDDPFSIMINSSVFPGALIQFTITLQNQDGVLQTFDYTMRTGYPQVDDPGGPDPYGYYVFDNGDITYSKAPVYNWIEIDPAQGGSGNLLDLNDNSEDDDDNTYVTLPFMVKFYGQSYSEITVCSNGWLAFGRTSMVNPRNWSIPTAYAPDALVAPFWDDLILSNYSPPGKVYSYYDSANHLFIVEWSNLRNLYNTNYKETFEVIIYDPDYYPTPTGDAEIKFQYKEVHNIDSYNNYATVGIMHPSHQFGTNYTYANQYPPTSKPLSANLALLFTTDPGSRVEPPAIACYPNQFNLMTPPEGITEHRFIVANTGGGDLVYNVNVEYFGARSESGESGIGGPDQYGYSWIDSDDEGGPQYDWIELPNDALLISFAQNDQAQGPFNIGFEFPFYGETYTQLIINPNGWIGFGEDNTAYNNTGLPNPGAPRPAIMGYWDDLDPIQGGHVYYKAFEDKFVVWYNEVIHYPGSHNGLYDFQIILYPSGKIKIQYKNMEGETDLGTIGIQNGTGEIGLQVAYDSPYVHDGLALVFYPPQSWLTILNGSGVVSGGEQDTVRFQVDGSGIDEQGSANIIVSNNSESSPQYLIPVHVLVGNFGDVNFDGDVNVVDVVLVVNFVLNSMEPTPAQASAADLNHDGSIDVTDIVLLVNEILQ